jgi:hypothetical protein
MCCVYLGLVAYYFATQLLVQLDFGVEELVDLLFDVVVYVGELGVFWL